MKAYYIDIKPFIVTGKTAREAYEKAKERFGVGQLDIKRMINVEKVLGERRYKA